MTGSAGYDLMVWRDIDIHMPCEADRWAEWAGLAADIAIQFSAAGLQLHKASFLNDYVEPHPLGARGSTGASSSATTRGTRGNATSGAGTRSISRCGRRAMRTSRADLRV